MILHYDYIFVSVGSSLTQWPYFEQTIMDYFFFF